METVPVIKETMTKAFQTIANKTTQLSQKTHYYHQTRKLAVVSLLNELIQTSMDIKSHRSWNNRILLRWISWMCLRNDDWKGKRVCIVTGPNIALAITLIKRMKALFQNPEDIVQISFDTKETIIILNGVLIEAFPSHHIDAMRGLPNISMIFLDEASFFGVNDSANVLDVTERYIAKSDPYIVLCSNPNKPNDTDIMFKISRQRNENCIYHRMMLPYTVGLGNIFSHKEIEVAKKSNSFQREYDLAFLGVEGNVFLPQKIDEADGNWEK